MAEQPAPAAAVVRNDQVVAWVSGEHRALARSDAPVPWSLIDAALAAAGAGRDDVDLVAVAGQFQSPISLRARPRLRRLLTTAFSPVLDVQAAWQSLLKTTGFGAYAADVAAEWLDEQFRDRGFDHGRLLTVDVHRALAEAAYRMQRHDDVLVVAMQPMGDGVAVSVHHGHGGQLDRLFVQTDVASVHVHLARAAAALGLRDDAVRPLEVLASEGTPDAAMVAILADHLGVDGDRFSRVNPLADPMVWTKLSQMAPADGAASVMANLTRVVKTIVSQHVQRHRVGHVALVGALFDAPRLVAQVAECDGVDDLSVLPRPGRDVLALGAAIAQAGLAPMQREVRLAPTVDDAACARALTMAGLSSHRRASLTKVLVGGGAVVRFRGRAGPGPIGQGQRCVLVRADDPYAIAHVRQVLGLGDDVAPVAISVPTPNEGDVSFTDRLAQPLAAAMAAPAVPETFARRYAPVVGADGRSVWLRAEPETHPGLHAIVQALLRASGCGAVAAFPLVDAEGALVTDPESVVRLFRRTQLPAMQLGDYYVERDPA